MGKTVSSSLTNSTMVISYRVLKAGIIITYNDVLHKIEYVRYSRPDLYLKLENIEELVREDKVIAPIKTVTLGD